MASNKVTVNVDGRDIELTVNSRALKVRHEISPTDQDLNATLEYRNGAWWVKGVDGAGRHNSVGEAIRALLAAAAKNLVIFEKRMEEYDQAKSELEMEIKRLQGLK